MLLWLVLLSDHYGPFGLARLEQAETKRSRVRSPCVWFNILTRVDLVNQPVSLLDYLVVVYDCRIILIVMILLVWTWYFWTCVIVGVVDECGTWGPIVRRSIR